ncbi:MAG TPA: VOC family protein, partial [Kofleriaceae bacterium]|nr:VOC family protein [Kofleriaceae bacterium]
MHRSRLSTFVLDCKVSDLDAAAEFWSKALGRELHPPDPTEPSYRQLTTSDDEPLVLLQKVEHDSRIHLDIEADDLDVEVDAAIVLDLLQEHERLVVGRGELAIAGLRG